MLPMAAMVETAVMVMERLMSPLNMSVQKLELVPPGLQPNVKSPKR